MFNRSLRYELKGSNVSSTVVLPARMRTGFADNAYKSHSNVANSVYNFNKQGGGPEDVAKVVVKKMNSGKEVITPTFKAKLWYLMRYFGWIVDLVMKNSLGPKELAKLE